MVAGWGSGVTRFTFSLLPYRSEYGNVVLRRAGWTSPREAEMTTTTTEFTFEQVAALAELVRPHLSADWGIDAAVALAEAREREDFERRIGSSLIVEALMGTYDEFRAEAGLL